MTYLAFRRSYASALNTGAPTYADGLRALLTDSHWQSGPAIREAARWQLEFHDRLTILLNR